MSDLPIRETRITRVHVSAPGEPIFSEMATVIEIEDEGSGEFIKISQEGGNTEYEKFLLVGSDDWPQLRWAIDQMIKECRK